VPKDAKVAFFYVQDKCATLEIASATLQPILSKPQIGNHPQPLPRLLVPFPLNGSTQTHDSPSRYRVFSPEQLEEQVDKIMSPPPLTTLLAWGRDGPT